MEQLDAVVIGAGVVGLAVARALARAGREVVVLEAEDAIGTHTSSRNSEVIHAGIYYPKGSLKARACVEGRALLYAYCAAHGVPHRRSGKLIVAAEEAQVAALEKIQEKAHANGVTDVVWMTRAQALALEPELSCVAALFSPSTGIIDSHALMLAYLGDAEARGAMLALKSSARARSKSSRDGFVLHVERQRCRSNASMLVNCCRAQAPTVARQIEGYPCRARPGRVLREGQLLLARPPLALLPPRLPGARARRPRRARHARPRRAGALRARRRMGRAHRTRLRRRPPPRRALLRRDPALLARRCPTARSLPGYAGIRPKTAGPKEPAPDFEIEGPAEHGVAGLVNLFGIESPGLTASLALAKAVLAQLENR